MVNLKSEENVITLGKLIGLLFLFCLPLLSILFLKTKRNDLARPVMGTIFLVGTIFVVGERAKRARHSQVCSIENRGYIYIYILEKWFPLWGERAHSLKLFCMYDKRFEI